MKLPTKLVSRLLIIAFITTTFCMQQLKSMEHTSTVEEDTPVTTDNPDFHLYMLLSSTTKQSPLWLPTDIIRSITIIAHNITNLMFKLKLDCSTPSNLFIETHRLNCFYKGSTMPIALLKIYLCDYQISLLDIKSHHSWVTVFDTPYRSGLEPEMRILCHLVDKKEFIDHFKESFSRFGLSGKTNLLHRLMWYETNAQIIQLYCGVFMDYAHKCAKKSKEVLNLLKAKDDYGNTVVDIAENDGQVTIAAIFKSTINVLKRTIQEKQNCVIQ